MKFKRFLFFGLLFSIRILNAQIDFRPGYIIKNNGDTLYGHIDYQGDFTMGKICKFQGIDNSIIDYSPDEILAFRFIDSKYFISKEVNDKKVFLEFLIKGIVNVYYMRDEDGDYYFIDKEDVGLTEIPYKSGIKHVEYDKKYYSGPKSTEKQQVFYESKHHLGVLTYYMQDAPEMKSRIQTIKKPEHQNLVKLAKSYHNAVCKDEECIVYSKPLPFVTIFPEITGGVIQYYGLEGLNSKLTFNSGIIGHIWLPRSNEKLFFKTGILISQQEFKYEKKSYHKIPFQLEYIYPKGDFRPVLSYGFNFYSFVPYLSLNLGGNLKLSDSFVISATTELEFNHRYLVIPNSFLAYSFRLGFFMKYN